MQRTHKYTWEKVKLIFLMPILEITIKNSFQLKSAPNFWCPGTRTLVPPQFFWCFLGCLFSFMLAVLDCCCCFCVVDVYKTIAGTLPPNMSAQNH